MFHTRVVGLSCALLVLACVPHPEAPTATLEKASARVLAGSTNAQDTALAGFHALLIDGDAEHARALFDASLSKSPSNAFALTGQVQLATRQAQPMRALVAALDLCERAPHHPLANAAARTVLDLAGQARAIDDLIRARVPGILSAGIEGDAAQLLRASLMNAYLGTRDVPAQKSTVEDLGMPTVATLVGPFSAWHQLSMAEPTQVEKTGNLDGLTKGPLGPLTARELHFADGRFALSGEPMAGDVYLLAVDVTVPEKTTWVLRTITSMNHVALIDGAPILSRLTWERPASTLTERALVLSAGVHRIVVRMARERQAGNLSVALHRLDGKSAKLNFAAAHGPAAKWNESFSFKDNAELYPTAASLFAALQDDAGNALASYLAARDALGRDHDGAARLVAQLPANFNGPLVAMLRADLALQDRTIPSRVGKGRANRELEAALAKDSGYVLAQMTAAQLALDDGRQLEALEQLKRAKAMATPAGGPVQALTARVQLALGLDAAAAATAHEAATALAGLCDAVNLEYDVARRRDAIAEADTLLAATAHCSGYDVRAAEHFRTRGQLEKAATFYAHLLALDESQAQVAISLSGLYSAQHHFDDALALLAKMRALWPRNTLVLKAMADVHEQAGHAAEALALREEALGFDGADLQLLRAVTRAKTGKEVLEEEAISTDEAIKSWQAAPGSAEATSTFVLDAAAIRAYPDGSMVDRIHIIQKALDQQGVQEIAEVQIPQEATVLKLRTIKPDGHTLEPETIEGKEGNSLPGVQVGDFIEYEYLLAHPSRGPGQPGFTASNFYFQIAKQPNARSTYVVKAPLGSGLKVDAHNVVAPKPVVEGDLEVFRHEERRVPPFIPEPVGPPSGNEWLPFVAVGAGQEGNQGVFQAYADAFVDRGVITWEVDDFATKAAGSAQGIDAVKAVYAAVMQKLSGRDAGLTVSAAASVSQDRGSRIWLLYSALRARGFDVRLAAVRTFTADPAPYLFPSEGLFNYVCVRVRLPDGQVIWLDPLVRFAPFNELPEFAQGGREAWLLPEPGKAAEKVATPPSSEKSTKDVRLTMRLSEDGVLSGEGLETYSGFEAAQLGEALESISADQRDQALQSALSRYFGGADLSSLKVDSKREVGGVVTVGYQFVAKRFARAEGPGHLVAGGITFPHMLGRRFLNTSTRSTTLFVEATETSRVKATITLPAGWQLDSPVADVKLEGPTYRYVRQEKQDKDMLIINEDFRLGEARIAVKDYDAFAQFAGEVDLVQQRDVLFEKK